MIKLSFFGKVIYHLHLGLLFSRLGRDCYQWVKEHGGGIVIDYDLVKINDHKSHSFCTVSSLEDFANMFDTEWAREWVKANNCKDIVYKLELVEGIINGMTNLGKIFLEHEVTLTLRCQTSDGSCKRIERCLTFRCYTHGTRKTEERTNARSSRSRVLAFLEDPVGYKIELTEGD